MPLAGVHSISASAGTGKTYAITTLYLRFLIDPDAHCAVDSILVTTFTEAATAELKDRLRGRLKEALRLLETCDAASARTLADAGRADSVLVELLESVNAWDGLAMPDDALEDQSENEGAAFFSPDVNEGSGSLVKERIEDALLSFDQAPVFTIHGFCNRILQELVFETGSRFDAELVMSTKSLRDEAVSDFAARWWTTSDSQLSAWLKLDGSLWKSMESVAQQALENPGVSVVPDGGELESLLDSNLQGLFRDCVRQLAMTWAESGPPAIELLQHAVDTGELNKTKYGKATQIEESVNFLLSVIQYPDPDQFKLDSRLGPTQQRLGQDAIRIGTKKGRTTPQHELFERWQDVVDVVRQISGHRSRVCAAMLSRLAESVREQVERRKRESGVMSFSDLLHQVDGALTGDRNEFVLEALRDRYRVAMVDEFQDTDPVQYRIFRQVFVDGVSEANDGRAFVMIGDPKQSIYRFRGADIHACLQAIRETPTGNLHEMGMNWRSDRSLVDAVQAAFGSSPDPFLSPEIGLPGIEARYDDRLKNGPAFSVTVVPNPYSTEKSPASSQSDARKRVVRRVADDIVAQLKATSPTIDESQSGDEVSQSDGRRIEPRDIAVLCRAGFELRLIQQQLADRGVPAVLQTEESVFDSPEAAALVHVLRSVLSAGSQSQMGSALQTSVFGLDADQLDSVRHDEHALSDWIERFHLWRDGWLRDGFVVMWSRLLEEQGTIARLAGQITGERQITNYLHLGELLHSEAELTHSGPDELLRWLEQMVAEPERRTEDQSQLRLETDAAAVQLCTIHKSKGLEYAVVYYPTLWAVRGGGSEADAVLSRLASSDRPRETHELDVGSEFIDQRREQDHDEQKAEDRRLLYVALTRAKHQCNIYWTPVENGHRSALGNLMRIDTPKLGNAALEDHIAGWLRDLRVGRVELRGSRELAAIPDSGRFTARNGDRRQLACRAMSRPVIRSLQQTSFTALARSATSHHPDEIADRDAVPVDQRGESDLDSEMPDDTQVPLAELTGGRQLGEVVHQVFEDVLARHGLAGKDEAAIRDVVREHLRPGMQRHQIDSEWIDTLTTAISVSLTRPLTTEPDIGVPTCGLLDIESSRLTCEMPFLMRLRLNGAATESSAFVAAFEQSSQPSIQNYADRVRGMSVSGLRGFLAGFIDLVFEHNGRWFVLDYKTNNLGPNVGDYSMDRLRQAMVEHDYILQYHIYVVALDALLRQRIPRYSYADHFGGVVYLFVRAVQPECSALDGVFFDCPDEAVIRGLAEAIMGT